MSSSPGKLVSHITTYSNFYKRKFESIESRELLNDKYKHKIMNSPDCAHVAPLTCTMSCLI